MRINEVESDMDKYYMFHEFLLHTHLGLSSAIAVLFRCANLSE